MGFTINLNIISSSSKIKIYHFHWSYFLMLIASFQKRCSFQNMRTCRETRLTNGRGIYFFFFWIFWPGRARYKQMPADGKVWNNETMWESALLYLIWTADEESKEQCAPCSHSDIAIIPPKTSSNTLGSVVCCIPHSPSTESVSQKKFICLCCLAENQNKFEIACQAQFRIVFS